MSENPLSPPPPETQSERWLKYGGNVALSAIVVIALAIIAVAIAQRQNRRLDTTSDKQYSLKPQTINIIRDLKAPIRIVSLYTKAETTPTAGSTDYSAAVADLLDEYKRSGRNIDTEVIDPINQPSKVDDLVADVTNKYGGEVARYRAFVDDAPAKYFAPIRAFSAAEAQRLAALPIDRMKQDEVNQTMGTVSDTLAGLPGRLDKVQKSIGSLTKQKVPDYKGAADAIQSELASDADLLNKIGGAYVQLLGTPQDAALISPPLKAYLTDAAGRFDDMKKTVDAADADYKKLGDLKLDDVRQKLREKDAILVLGPGDMRSLSFDQVWQADTSKAAYRNSTDATIKPKFAGEQMITGAILQLTEAKKPKVVFLRPGGGPLTAEGFMGINAGPLSAIASRLRDYNFDVLEKDLSGQYAAQAQMQGEQVAPDPTDDEIKDAVWVMINFPVQQQSPDMPPPTNAPKLIEHLANGGSALCLFLPQADNLSAALDPWGVKVRTDHVIVHAPIKTAVASDNFVEEAQKVPTIFVTNRFGDSLITKPLNSLDACLVPLLPVEITPKAGYTATPIVPIPQDTQAWGAHDVEGALGGGDVKYQPDAGDIGPPLWGGAVVQEEKTGARLVALGSLQFALNQMLNIRDPDLAARGIPAARFPANSDLFLNSVFWLAHQEPLIAISPSAMEVSRLADMSDAALRFWRVGVLLIGLPGLVVLCGIGVYFARRD